ncbi:MAG TPA: helix-turn-helix domain-containing protein [Solirubrobacterales bacterium]|nr:helix-turn-helix domain-containing protein [Solirubrobacterales bacterium]
MSNRGMRPIAGGSRLAAGRTRRASASTRSLDEAYSTLASRLRERLPELEAAIATRAYAISDPSEATDPAYVHGLRAALTAALEYGLAAIELGERRGPSVPPALLAEARLAARAGVTLDTVLRRYIAGNAIFGDFLVEEAERADVSNSAVRRVLRRQATLFDRLLETVSAEHAREAKSWPSSSAERRRECVKSLLAGELVDHSELGYDLGGHHLALMAKGERAPEAMRALAAALDRRLLAVCREEEPIWACWLGGGRPLEAVQAQRALGEVSLDRVFVTIGEPGEGLSGWRLSHRQAKAALPIAERKGQSVLRYGDVTLLAAVLRDDLVATSLHQLYLEPLEQARDGGKMARETLRAYFAAGRNVSSTAAALGVDRRTVSNRIRAVEELFGRPLGECATELETALQLDD